ncbi:MAG: DUF389 domain-containing protein [Acidimicrobiia bacterium]
MLHLRLIVPTDLVTAVMEILKRAPEVTNLWHLAGAAAKPPGDLVSCDVAKEEATRLLGELRALGLEERGSIAAEYVDASISRAAREAELAAVGTPADAVVWEEVEGRVMESASLSVSFLVLMTIATMIGAIGLVNDSTILLIGAMVVGPEYGPLAGISVALVEGRLSLAAKSLRAILVGFPLGIVAAAALTGLLRLSGIAPQVLLPEEHSLAVVISDPNWYSVIIAVLAGAAGMLALAGAKSGVLIGVLISVTTIPAAANVGVAAVYGDWDNVLGGVAQLAINLTAIVVSGVVVLWVIMRARLRRSLQGSGPHRRGQIRP